MYSGVTSIKKEPVDDGSIFVCFVCEKEFTKVFQLNNHMKQHAENSDDPTIEESQNVLEVGEIKKIQLTEEQRQPSKNSGKNGCFDLINENLLRKQSAQFKPKKVQKEKNSSDLAAERARKVQMYIQSRENKFCNKKESSNEATVEDDPYDSLLFSEDLNSSSRGTILMSEPEGFICPSQRSKNKFVKDKVSETITQRATEDTDEGVEEPINFFSEGSASRYTSSRVKTSLMGNRLKRGRPPLATSKQLFFDRDFEDGHFLTKQDGRRTGTTADPVENKYKCSDCLKVFVSVQTLKVHMKSHADAKEISCPMCQAVFPQRYILYEHIANDHEEAIDDLVCNICNKIFTRPDSLKTHMVRMHDRHGGLNCMICGKNFPSQAQLEIHVRVHTGERPFKCMECSRGFVQKVHLKTHLRTMHNIEEPTSTPCRMCGVLLKGRNSLRDHYTIQHALSTAQYRTEVMRLRREGKIPEKIPPTIKVVSPNFTYRNVSALEFTDGSATSSPFMNKTNPQNHIRNKNGSDFTKIMNANDDIMFSPNDRNDFSRNEDELKFVESAFKVAEEMDLLGEGQSALIVPTDEASTSSMYYTLPTMMESGSPEMDELQLTREDLCQFGVTGAVDQKGRVVMAEPLEAVDANSTGAVEMLSM